MFNVHVSSKKNPVQTYLFPVELTEEADGRWSAVCPALRGCATWAHTKQEALHSTREAVEVSGEDMFRAGEQIPESVQRMNSPAVSITM